MYELKVAAPKFILAALEAGKKARYEGAILILTRGLSISHQRELIESWSDLDDVTHNEILVLTFGVSKKHSGIIAYGIKRHVVADEVSVVYPFSESFDRNFEKLLKVAEYIPWIGGDPHRVTIDSHGATDIRRALGISERQLPTLFIVSYWQGAEYVVELGSDEMQLSPVRFITALARNLDDVPYKYRNLQDKAMQLFKLPIELPQEIEQKRRSLDKLIKLEQLELLINQINNILVDVPGDLRDMGEKIIGFLSGKDEKLELIKYYKSSLISYALSQDKSSVVRKLPRKLRKAIGLRIRDELFEAADRPQISPEDRDNKRKQLELELSRIRQQIRSLRPEEKSLYRDCAALSIETVFTSAIEAIWWPTLSRQKNRLN